MRTIRPGTRSLWVIAHRGSSATHPENTAAAFDAALAEGCDGIETDVQLSADGVPFVFHDRTLARVGAGRRVAARLTMAELREVDAGSWKDPRFRDERLLSLGDLLSRYAGRTLLLIEMKIHRGAERSAPALARAVAREILDRRAEGGVALLCFDLAALEAAREAAPRIRRALNLRARGALPQAARRALDRLWALSLDLRSLAPSHVRAAHARRRPVLTYTCNTRAGVRWALACGADAIMTDRPAWLRAELDGEAPGR